DGSIRKVGLYPRSVADLYAEVIQSLEELGIEVRIHDMPNELPDPIRFNEDNTHASYDRDFAERHWRVLAEVERVLFKFRTSFLGKCSPVHFFWGSFDLAVTRFSGRRAPPSSWGRALSAGSRYARGLFARGQQRGLLAWQRSRALPRVLLLCLSRAGGFRVGAGQPGRGVL